MLWRCGRGENQASRDFGHAGSPGPRGRGQRWGSACPNPASCVCLRCSGQRGDTEEGRKEGPMRVPPCGLRSKLLLEPGQQLLCL